MSSLLDIGVQSKNMREAVERSIREAFPIEGQTRRIELVDVWVPEEKDPDDFAAQKAAKMRGRSYATPVYASLRLVDKKTKKVLDSSKRIKLAELPVMTPRNSFIVKGNEYQVTHQLRLRPGVYTQFGADGKLSSQVNLAKGRNFRVWLDPAEAIFRVSIGTSNIYLYPLLLDLGVSDNAIEAAWGKDVAALNRAKSAGTSQTEINKLYKNLFYRETPPDRDTAISRVKEYFRDRTEIDKETTSFTLGKAHENVNPGMLMDISKKLLAVSQDKEKTDDRNHLSFKSVHSVDDFLSERLQKMSARIQADLSRNIDNEGKATLAEVISREAFHKPIESLFTQTQLSSTPEQINPLHMVAGMQKTTVFGEGGISEKALTPEARGVHPSHLGLLDPVQTPEAHTVGAMFRLPVAARKEGQTLKTVVYDPKTRKKSTKSARELHDLYVAFPDQFKFDEKEKKFKPVGDKVMVQHQGEVKEVPVSKVDQVLSTSRGLFGLSVNMIPFLDSNNGNRVLTASRMQEQALPLLHREQPLVQAQMSQGRTYEDSIAREYKAAAFSPVAGKVTAIDEDGTIHIKPNAGRGIEKVRTYKDFPLNAKHFYDSELKVQVGDRVTKGQLLADTNYTKDGKLAIGTNLRVAYLPYRGYNYEDGVVVSESAAEKLTSLHMYKEAAESGPEVIINKAKFLARFPSKFTAAQLAKLDEDGVVREGQVLEEGDPMILSMTKSAARPEDGILQAINRSLVKPYRDTSVTWVKGAMGMVSNVSKHGKNVEVYVKTQEPLVVGDKIAGRHGNKGIIVKVLPDGDMPKAADGTNADVLLNPNGVPSRINLGQLLETATGKIAKKQGNPITVKNFLPDSNVARVQKQLKDAGLSDTEELFDGKDGKSLGKVATGQQFIMKLDHSVAKKFNARDTGGYTADEVPGKGGSEGAQSIDPLLFYSLVSHGAKENLHEMATVKGTKNDEFWRAYQLGQRLPAPKPTFAFEKFSNMLQGLGVNVEKKGNEFSLIPMTDDDIAKMSAGSVKSGALFKTRGVTGLTEEKGGLFDPSVTGGSSGSKWSHIDLAEPMPNPLFEDAIKTVLGIKQKQFDDILQGRQAVSTIGQLLDPKEVSPESGLTGGRAFETMLSQIDMDKRIKELRQQAVGTKGQKLNTLNKEIRYLEALKKNGLDPSVYVVNKVPVMPPKFRPVYASDNGSLITSDVNLLYKDLILSNEALQEKKDLGFPVQSVGETAAHLYNQQKLLSGLGGEATTYPGVRTPKGIITTISGLSSPKSGFYQSKLVRRRQDLSARTTVVPEPQLSVDEIGIPKKMLQTIFRKPVIRRLVKLGYSPLQAQEEIDKDSAIARRALELETEARPVMMNRAPSLHKFNMMAFKPKITDGKAVKVHPLVVKGYNMDFDGDAVAIHAPVTDAAVKEAFSMLPTQNLFNPGTGDMMVVPGQEAILGLYRLTEKGKSRRKEYANFLEAKEAVKRGEISATDVVTIGGQRTTVGRYTVNLVLPESVRDFDSVFNKKKVVSVLKEVAASHPHDFGQVADGLKDLGNEHAYRVGSTLSLDDLQPLVKEREAIFRKIQPKLKTLDVHISQARSEAKRQELLQQKVDLYNSITPDIDNLARKLPSTNNVRRMVDSGARGNYAQVRQMIAAPVLLSDTSGDAIPIPVKKSYAEGLDTASYWIQSYGARTGAVDKSLQTAVPGYFNKRLVNTLIDTTITEVDCGTRQGRDVDIDSDDAQNRYTAGDKFGIPRNTLVTPRVLNIYRRKKQKTIRVRSPLTCEAKDGLCAKCFGQREHGRDSSIGDNVGVMSAQAIGEPATQMQMRTFHTGGVAAGGIGSGLKSGFERILQLTELPSTVRNAATLAEEKGTVSQVTPAPAGGNFVFVGSRPHYVPERVRVTAQPGDEVEAGDSLSAGEVNPHDLLRLKGMRTTQEHLTRELKREYHGQGMKLRPNIIETAVRKLTNLTRITDPGDSEYAPGDYAPLSRIQTKIQGGASIQHAPELKGINQAPLYGNEDWLSQLNFQNLKKTVINAASKNWTSSIHGTNPVAAWAYGAEFARGEEPGTY